jgi:hypothetical protein
VDNFLLGIWDWLCGHSSEQWTYALGAGLAVGAVTYFMLSLRRPKAVMEYEYPKVYTRKEDMDRWVRGQITLDEYLDLHRDEPEDGSLTAEKAELSSLGQRVFDRAYEAASRDIYPTFEWYPGLEVPVSRRCNKEAHLGKRISILRVRNTDIRGTEIFQPVSRKWILPGSVDLSLYPCCERDYIWVNKVNGVPV